MDKIDIHNVTLLSHKKRNLSFVTMWMGLRLNEMSDEERQIS